MNPQRDPNRKLASPASIRLLRELKQRRDAMIQAIQSPIIPTLQYIPVNQAGATLRNFPNSNIQRGLTAGASFIPTLPIPAVHAPITPPLPIQLSNHPTQQAGAPTLPIPTVPASSSQGGNNQAGAAVIPTSPIPPVHHYRELIQDCVANPGRFLGKWNLLVILYGEGLYDYVHKCAWTEAELKPFVIKEELLEEEWALKHLKE